MKKSYYVALPLITLITLLIKFPLNLNFGAHMKKKHSLKGLDSSKVEKLSYRELGAILENERNSIPSKTIRLIRDEMIKRDIKSDSKIRLSELQVCNEDKKAFSRNLDICQAEKNKLKEADNNKFIIKLLIFIVTFLFGGFSFYLKGFEDKTGSAKYSSISIEGVSFVGMLLLSILGIFS